MQSMRGIICSGARHSLALRLVKLTVFSKDKLNSIIQDTGCSSCHLLTFDPCLTDNSYTSKRFPQMV